MKKMLSPLCLLGMASAAFAQPSIQASQFNYASLPAFTYKSVPGNGQTPIAEGAAGANVTWDFSASSSASTSAYTTAACPGDADCGLFPTANQVVKVGALAKVYYNKTNAGMEQVGEKASGTITYTDPMKVLQFPMTFNQTFSDIYASNNGADSKNGTLSSTIDAYGTLKTATGTYTNVLRQKIVETATVVTSGQTAQLQITHHYWMKADMHHYLFAIIKTEFTGLPIPVPATYVGYYTTATAGPVGIDNKDALAAAMDIYPNPAGKELTIRNAIAPIEQVDIFNMVGQKMLSRTVTGNQFSVVFHDLKLSPGYYFTKISTTKGVTTKQVVIR